jgi:hypothetical protein
MWGDERQVKASLKVVIVPLFTIQHAMKVSAINSTVSPGDYFLDLHFAEILYNCGAKGIRLFDVLVQDENENITC